MLHDRTEPEQAAGTRGETDREGVQTTPLTPPQVHQYSILMETFTLRLGLLLAVASVSANPRRLRGLADADAVDIQATIDSMDVSELKELAKNEVIQAKFLGNVVGHAKMLCTLVKSIDCWQNDPSRETPSQNIGEAMSLIQVFDFENKPNFVDAGDLMEKVKQICKIVDKGVDGLPELLPGFKDKGGGLFGGWLGKLPWLGGLKDILKGIIGGGGGSGKLKPWFDLIFSKIPMTPIDNDS